MGSLLRRWLLTIGWHDLSRDPTLVIQLEDLIAEMATVTKFDSAVQHLKHSLRIVSITLLKISKLEEI